LTRHPKTTTFTMKFFYPLALALAAVVAAQDDDCDAAPIVEACLSSETAKVKDCDTLDYDCLCAAYQAVATCYNNCPKDSRAPSAQNEVTIYCQQASLHGSAAQRKTQTVASATGSATNAVASNSATATATRTATDEAASTSSSSTATSTPNMGVGQLARNTGGVLLAVAGVVAAVL
ncbi:GPI anchored serine-threonine rich protein, partial [Colletotrichum tofieldiae]